ncbi:hypothetical protein H2200_006030 [Cladophialophora chaetospira]|uniref:Uncharacterized protein n=1 Tax=Cladophialophora chaetospira TaxID=386627 RepID=A0AA39CJ02_9EURO|nr:hypothetical protein H2200_006030 [Cladophialophora chaetospira]
MAPPEKRPLQNSLIDTSIPTDSPPSYEHTILPASNPWTDTPTTIPTIPQPNTHPQTPSSQPPISIPSQNPLSSLSRLSKIPFSKYRVRDSKLSDDQTALTTTSPELTSTGTNSATNAQVQRNVARFITEQATLPPKPIMVVRGTHLSNGVGATVVDFELKFNLTSLLELSFDQEGAAAADGGSGLRAANPRSAGKVKIQRYQHGSSNGSPRQLSREERNMSPLELWAKKFCEDKAENRSFTLTRTTNLPTSLLEGYMRNLLASAKYRGKLSISFPVQNATVTIVRKSSNWFTNMLRLYPTKKYEAVSVEWAVSGTAASSEKGRNGGNDASRPSLQRGDTNHSIASEVEGEPDAGSSAASTSSQPAGVSPESDSTGLPALVAQAWWREWHFAIWNSILSGKKGWVTVEDWIEAKMGVREKERGKEWGADYE